MFILRAYILNLFPDIVGNYSRNDIVESLSVVNHLSRIFNIYEHFINCLFV